MHTCMCTHTVTATYTHTHTYTHGTYLHLRTRGCYITDGKCLVFFLWITWPLPMAMHLLAFEWSPTDCSTYTCTVEEIVYINSKVH